MITVGSYEAKTHLPSLIDKVMEGEVVTITKHGVPVARLEAIPKPAMTRHEAVEAMLRFSEGITLGPGMTIKEMIEFGRVDG